MQQQVKYYIDPPKKKVLYINTYFALSGNNWTTIGHHQFMISCLGRGETWSGVGSQARAGLIQFSKESL